MSWCPASYWNDLLYNKENSRHNPAIFQTLMFLLINPARNYCPTASACLCVQSPGDEGQFHLSRQRFKQVQECLLSFLLTPCTPILPYLPSLCSSPWAPSNRVHWWCTAPHQRSGSALSPFHSVLGILSGVLTPVCTIVNFLSRFHLIFSQNLRHIENIPSISSVDISLLLFSDEVFLVSWQNYRTLSTENSVAYRKQQEGNRLDFSLPPFHSFYLYGLESFLL